jgi:hypothetical protein
LAEAIQARITNPCPLCAGEQWEPSPQLVTLSLEAGPDSSTRDGQRLACAMLTCTRCGNTHLLNVVTLGLADWFGV